MRISAQLIDATSGQHVWAETYDRELTDVFAVQDEISSAIAASLAGDLQRAEQVRAERRAPGNLEAWGLFQRSVTLLYRFTREGNEEARPPVAQPRAVKTALGPEPEPPVETARTNNQGDSQRQVHEGRIERRGDVPEDLPLRSHSPCLARDR